MRGLIRLTFSLAELRNLRFSLTFAAQAERTCSVDHNSETLLCIKLGSERLQALKVLFDDCLKVGFLSLDLFDFIRLAYFDWLRLRSIAPSFSFRHLSGRSNAGLSICGFGPWRCGWGSFEQNK
jgi:hypothetical protein